MLIAFLVLIIFSFNIVYHKNLKLRNFKHDTIFIFFISKQTLVVYYHIFYSLLLGNSHLVPLLIPKDSFKAMNKLCKASVRRLSGVNPTNIYVFASTRDSEDHQSGWHALNKVCDKLNLKEPDKIKSTSNRHRISTLFAALDLDPNERQVFFKHMGHSKEINEHVYQNPLAIQEVVTVGKSLLQIDAGKTILIQYLLTIVATDMHFS